MKFFKLILFLLVTNTILGQSYWTFKQKPLVPISNLAVEPDDTVSTTNLLNTSTPKRLNARAAINTSGCIDNIDFEMGNFTNWKCYKGSAKTTGTTNYTVWSPTTPVAPVANRHQIISAASLPVNDMYGGFPRLCPNGGNYSVQLGNNATGAQAEKISCSFTIPADQNNFQIEYYYAVVFQDPNHPFDEQPRFQAKVYDANNSSNIINCASYDFTAASGLPGFKVSGVDPSVLYKPWSAVTINLSGYAGHTVILEFTTEDCTLGAHFGYAYIDVSSTCVSLTSSSTYCKNTPSLTLNAPSGYEEYNWYNSSYTKLLGTGQTLTLTPPPTSDDVVNVDLVPYPGFGCRDTAYTVLKVNPSPIVAFNSDSTVCVGKPISFTNNSSISDNSTLSYFWDFGDNTTSTSTNYTKTYNSTGTYKVRLISTSINGCTDSIIRYVTVGNLAVINPIVGNKNICVGQNESLFEATTGGTWRSTNPSVATITDAGLLTAVSGGIDTIRYIVSNKYGCTDSVSFFINTIVNTNSITNASICKGDTYTFNGTTYNTAGTYTVHLVNVAGCDSTATLNLLVKLPTTSTSNALICQGDTYTFNGTVYNASGTYTAHLVNVAGCDSTATLNLSVKLPTTSTTNALICQGDTYTFNGTVYNTAGTYTVHLVNIAGCDSIATLNLSLKLPTTSTTNASICQGDTYTFNGTNYNTSGTYTAHLVNVAGCDSTATLNLSVKLPTTSTTNASICQGDTYTFNGTVYNTVGTYTAHLVNVAGCDSTATLNLSVKLPTTSTTNALICQGDTYTFNGTNYNTVGTYTAHLVNVAGCDSTATLNLSVKLPTTSTTNASICDGGNYVFNGTTYTNAGVYIAHLINAVGCDSVATLNLNINSPTISELDTSICQGDTYTFNGTVYNTSGTYTAHLVNVAGCDSTATLNLSVKLPTTSTTNASICQGDTYTFNGTVYNTVGTYTAHLVNVAGCDSTATLNLSLKLPTTSTTNASICQSDTYTFNGTVYNTSGTYTAHLVNVAGCDSIATLNLSIKLPTTSTTNASICQGDTYTFNGTVYNTAGTYTAHLVNVAGCDSTATLNLSVKLPTTSTTNASICDGGNYVFNGTTYTNAGVYIAHLINAVGCDSVATLNLNVNSPTISELDTSICQGDTYTFNGTVYNTSGTYTAHLVNVAGCDSTATLNLSVKLPTTSTTNASICQGDTYTFNGTNYNASGTYTAHLVNVAGCDSTATLNLSLKLPTTSTTNASICQGNTYTFNGTVYNASGTYTAHLLNVAGCDSTATLNLSVKLPTTSTTNASICDGGNYVFNGTTYTNAGVYIAHLINAVGCDSVATLNLNINSPTISELDTSICQGDTYTFNGTVYNTSGTYTAHLVNVAGCDSTATLNLSVKLPTTSTTNASICQGDTYTFNGTVYNTSGTYTAHLVNVAGCDSTATLNLLVKLPTTSTSNALICQGDTYTFNGTVYNASGTYTVHLVNVAGCDSTATLNLSVKLPTTSITNASISQGYTYTFNGIVYSAAGTYTAHLLNIAGCDSIATLNLSLKLPTSSVINASICKNEAYSFNGKTYSSSGTYSAHLLNSVGSDSLEILNLTVKLPTLSISNAMVCQGESYRFNDVTYTKSGSYLAHLVNSVGCDSLALLVLKINKPTTSTTNLIVSSTQLPYVWNKMSFNETGIHTCPVHFVNSLGCDSTATLVLTVKTTPNTVTTASICEGDSYLFNGVNYSKTGIYDAHLISSQGIDSIATLNLTVNSTVNSYNNILLILGESYTINGHVYTQAGTYTDILKTTYGCDSTVVTDISTIKIPNTITPNGDGYNDVFMKNWHVKIYNRNGILLFEGQDGWDGTYNNRPVSKDTYFYVLYYTSDSQVKTKEGYLMVIR